MSRTDTLINALFTPNKSQTSQNEYYSHTNQQTPNNFPLDIIQGITSDKGVLLSEQQYLRLIVYRKQQLIQKQMYRQNIYESLSETHIFSDQYLNLHNKRRNISKDILDDEFDVLRLERQLSILRRNRGQYKQFQQSKQQSFQINSISKEKFRLTGSQIVQLPEDDEESLIQRSQIRKLIQQDRTITKASPKIIQQKIVRQINRSPSRLSPRKIYKYSDQPQRKHSPQKKYTKKRREYHYCSDTTQPQAIQKQKTAGNQFQQKKWAEQQINRGLFNSPMMQSFTF